MMGAQENDLITRIGPGTPCGSLMRRPLATGDPTEEMMLTQWHAPVDDENCYWYNSSPASDAVSGDGP